MKNCFKVAAVVSLLASSGAVNAEVSANIAVTNNYLFRGVTQTDNRAAIQGGIDFDHESGFYAGTWLSNVGSLYEDTAGTGNYEQDWYLGYGFGAGTVNMDVGYILYTYPVDSKVKADYGELYFNLGWQWLSAGIAYTTNKEDSSAKTGDIYLYFGGEFEASNGVGYGFSLGRYDFAGSGAADYNHVRLFVSKSDFTLTLEKNDTDQNEWFRGSSDYQFTVSWSKSFDF